MDDGIVQQGKGMCAAPPTGRVCWISTVGSPAVCLIFFQTVKVSHILRKANSLKCTHVFAAGEHIRTLHLRVDSHNCTGNTFFLIHLHGSQNAAQRRNKETPDQRLVCDRGSCPGGDPLRVDDLHGLPQKGFAVLSCGPVIQKHM